MAKVLATTRKGYMSRILQLKTGHALIAPYLVKIKKLDSTACWWCNENDQTVHHLLFRCPRWARDRDKFLSSLQKQGILIERSNVELSTNTIFQEKAYPALLEYIKTTQIGLSSDQTREEEEEERLDEWDIELLDE